MPRLPLLMLAILVIATAGASSSPDQRIVPADEIIAKIQNNQPVAYSNVIVSGDLDLSGLKPAEISTSFSLINSTVQNASFDGASFEKEAVFWGTTFRSASFNKTKFNANSDFSNTSFHRVGFLGSDFNHPVSFDGAEFQENVSFEESQFQKDASFNSVRFLGEADLNYTNFLYYTYFSGAQFLKNALFSDVKFQGTSDFSSADFSGGANFFGSQFGATSFTNCTFRGRAMFGLTRFSGLSSFGEALFSGEANFNLARFSDAVDFSRAQFKNKAFFGLVKFEDIASYESTTFDSELNLKSAQISTMLLDNASFGKNSKIKLNDADFKRLKAPWNEIRDYVVYDPGVYLALINNYRGLGWHPDEDDCYYRYRRLNQAEKGLEWSKAIDVLAWLSCGYGVRPSYTVAWAILTILAFALIFWKGDGIRRSAKPLQGPVEKDPVPERAIFRNALFFSTCIFLSQGPIDFLPMGRHRYYVIIEGILGWLLLALFLVTLGRIMIR